MPTSIETMTSISGNKTGKAQGSDPIFWTSVIVFVVGKDLPPHIVPNDYAATIDLEGDPAASAIRARIFAEVDRA